MQSACRLDQPSDFLRAQYARRPVMGVMRVRYGIDRQPPFQHTPEKEPQGGNMIHDRADRQLSFVQQMSLPLPYVIEAEPVGPLVEVSCKSLDSAEIAAYSFRREVTTLEFPPASVCEVGSQDLLPRNSLSVEFKLELEGA